MPKISVIMPVYNSEKYLRESIESILNQTFTDFEFILIDDCSTDNSWNIIEEYNKKDNRIIAIKNEKNMGVSFNRNLGIKKSISEYIAFLDSDDIALSERLYKQYCFLENNNNFCLCGTNFDIIDKNSKKIGERKFPENNEEIKKSILFFNPFGQNTILVRKSIFDQVGLYNESLKNAEDLDMWIRIGSKHNFYNIQENLNQYRIHDENTILKQQKLMIKNTLKIRKNAILNYGYKVNIKAIIFYIGAWIVQFLPERLVLYVFNIIRSRS